MASLDPDALPPLDLDLVRSATTHPRDCACALCARVLVLAADVRAALLGPARPRRKLVLATM
jgi:hypothetical protein